MSDNPFRDAPDANPYEPPIGKAHSASDANPLYGPAIALLVLSILFLLLLIASAPGQVMRLRMIDTSTAEGIGELAGGIVESSGMGVVHSCRNGWLCLHAAIEGLSRGNDGGDYCFDSTVFALLPFGDTVRDLGDCLATEAGSEKSLPVTITSLLLEQRLEHPQVSRPSAGSPTCVAPPPADPAAGNRPG